MLTFYKPNKSVKGSLLSINFSAKTDKVENDKTVKGDKSFYLNFVGQSGWNEAERTGSFKEGNKITVKLSLTEAGGILAAISRNTTLASVMGQEYVYHDGEKTATTIYFGPHFKKEKQGEKWVDTTNQVGFGIRVVKTEKANKENKEQLSIVLTHAETELLVNYIKDALCHVFDALFSENITRLKKNNENPPKSVDKLPEQPEPETVGDF
jgi:hypothetical protein